MTGSQDAAGAASPDEHVSDDEVEETQPVKKTAMNESKEAEKVTDYAEEKDAEVDEGTLKAVLWYHVVLKYAAWHVCKSKNRPVNFLFKLVYSSEKAHHRIKLLWYGVTHRLSGYGFNLCELEKGDRIEWHPVSCIIFGWRLGLLYEQRWLTADFAILTLWLFL